MSDLQDIAINNTDCLCVKGDSLILNKQNVLRTIQEKNLLPKKSLDFLKKRFSEEKLVYDADLFMVLFTFIILNKNFEDLKKICKYTKNRFVKHVKSIFYNFYKSKESDDPLSETSFFKKHVDVLIEFYGPDLDPDIFYEACVQKNMYVISKLKSYYSKNIDIDKALDILYVSSYFEEYYEVFHCLDFLPNIGRHFNDALQDPSKLLFAINMFSSFWKDLDENLITRFLDLVSNMENIEEYWSECLTNTNEFIICESKCFDYLIECIKDKQNVTKILSSTALDNRFILYGLYILFKKKHFDTAMKLLKNVNARQFMDEKRLFSCFGEMEDKDFIRVIFILYLRYKDDHEFMLNFGIYVSVFENNNVLTEFFRICKSFEGIKCYDEYVAFIYNGILFDFASYIPTEPCQCMTCFKPALLASDCGHSFCVDCICKIKRGICHCGKSHMVIRRKN